MPSPTSSPGIDRRRRGISERRSSVTSKPATSMSPSEGVSARYSIRSSVVLPAPLAPVRTTNSPLATWKEMPLKADTREGPAPKTFDTCCSRCRSEGSPLDQALLLRR